MTNDQEPVFLGSMDVPGVGREEFYRSGEKVTLFERWYKDSLTGKVMHEVYLMEDGKKRPIMAEETAFREVPIARLGECLNNDGICRGEITAVVSFRKGLILFTKSAYSFIGRKFPGWKKLRDKWTRGGP